jgi:hypothetical protein
VKNTLYKSNWRNPSKLVLKSAKSITNFSQMAAGGLFLLMSRIQSKCTLFRVPTDSITIFLDFFMVPAKNW